MQNGYNVNGVVQNRRNRYTTELSAELKMKKLFVVGLDFQIWTGSTVLRKEDFRIGENGQLPPDDVVENLGSKKLLDTTFLNGFRAIRARARRLLEENGVRFMGGFAVPIENKDRVLSALDKCVEDFRAEKERFMANYQSYVDKWIAEHPELGSQLKADAKELRTVESRLYADYGTMQMQPLTGDEDRFSKKVDSLSSTLFRDIAIMANDFSRRSLLGKEKCRSWQPLLAMRRKLDSLSFLDGGIRPIIEMIDAVRAHLPKEGVVIEGSAFVELSACISILSNEETMRAAADGTVTIEAMTAQIAASRPVPPSIPADIPPAAIPSAPSATAPDEESLFESLFGAEANAPAATTLPQPSAPDPLPPQPQVPLPADEGETDDFERLFALAEERMEEGLVVPETPVVASHPASQNSQKAPDAQSALPKKETHAEAQRAEASSEAAEASPSGEAEAQSESRGDRAEEKEPEFPVHEVVTSRFEMPEIGEGMVL